MPELPEVETVRRTLAPLLTGRQILSVSALRPGVIHHPLPVDFCARLAGCRIEGLMRRGKFLLLRLVSAAGGQLLVVHLRMTGRLLCTPATYPQKPHTHVIFHLDQNMELRFSDTRRFGGLWLLADGETDTCTGMQKLGVEPLSAELCAGFLQQRLGRRRSTIKSGLLDQSVIAGLGNIYADETLYRAQIHPQQPCCTLQEKEWQVLAGAIPEVLQAAIANNGTTFHDFLDGEGREGQNMPFLQAYGRAGEPCRRCGAQMVKIRLQGRGTCFCPNCQRLHSVEGIEEER